MRPTVLVLSVHHLRQGGAYLRGGAEKYLHGTVQGLLAAGGRVVVAYSGDSIYDDIAAAHGPADVELVRTDWVDVRLAGDRRLDLATIRRRKAWIKRCRPDVVFVVQQGHGAAFAASVAAARWWGARVVMSIRQPPLEPPPATRKRYAGLVPSLELWRRRPHWRSAVVARCCDVILFNSDRVRGAYVAANGYPAGRCCVIRNGVEQCPRRSAPRGRRIGYVGQLGGHKGVDTLISAFRSLHARRPEAELVLFGEGPQRPRLAELAHGLPVCLAGHVADRDAIFNRIDLLALPARRESSSNAVLEAMARGIPCVVSDAGGLPELVDDGVNGRVVARDDVAGLTAALEEALFDPAAWSRFSTAGWERVRREHDPRRQLDATVAAVLGKTGLCDNVSNPPVPGERVAPALT